MLIQSFIEKYRYFCPKVNILNLESSKKCRIYVVLSEKQQKSKKILPESDRNRKKKLMIILILKINIHKY